MGIHQWIPMLRVAVEFQRSGEIAAVYHHHQLRAIGLVLIDEHTTMAETLSDFVAVVKLNILEVELTD